MEILPPPRVIDIVKMQVSDLISQNTDTSIDLIFFKARNKEIPSYQMIRAAMIANGGEMTTEELDRYRAKFNNDLFAKGVEQMLDEEEKENAERDRAEMVTEVTPFKKV